MHEDATEIYSNICPSTALQSSQSSSNNLISLEDHKICSHKQADQTQDTTINLYYINVQKPIVCKCEIKKLY